MASENPLVKAELEPSKEDEQLRLHNFHAFIVDKLGNLAPSLIEHNILPQVWIDLSSEDRMLFQNVTVLSVENQTELVQRILNTIGKIFNDMSVSTNDTNNNTNTDNNTDNNNDITLSMETTNNCDNLSNVINLSSEGLNYNTNNNAYNFLNNNTNLISTTAYNNLADRIIINVDNNNLATLATPTTTCNNNVLHSLQNYSTLLDTNNLLDNSINTSNASYFSSLLQNNVANNNIINNNNLITNNTLTNNTNNNLINNSSLINNTNLLNNINQFNIINNSSNNLNNNNFNLVNNPMTIELFQPSNNNVNSNIYNNQLVKGLVNNDNSQIIINSNNNTNNNLINDNLINNNNSSLLNNNILNLEIQIAANKDIEPGERPSSKPLEDSINHGDNFEHFESQLLLGLGLPDLGSVMQKGCEEGGGGMGGEFEVKALRSSLKERWREIGRLQGELSKVYAMVDRLKQENHALKKQQPQPQTLQQPAQPQTLQQPTQLHLQQKGQQQLKLETHKQNEIMKIESYSKQNNHCDSLQDLDNHSQQQLNHQQTPNSTTPTIDDGDDDDDGGDDDDEIMLSENDEDEENGNKNTTQQITQPQHTQQSTNNSNHSQLPTITSTMPL